MTKNIKHSKPFVQLDNKKRAILLAKMVTSILAIGLFVIAKDLYLELAFV